MPLMKKPMKSMSAPSNDLAMAYSVKRKAKKMAEGGSVKSEKRPMPDQLNHDAMQARESEAPKAHPAMAAEAKRPRIQAIKDRSIMKGPFKVRSADEIREDAIRLQQEDIGMAEGGEINDEVSMKRSEEDMLDEPAGLESDSDQMRPSMDEIMHSKEPMLADGGMIDDEDAIEHGASVASAIMAKRRKMAEGGEVDLAHNAEEDVHVEHDLNLGAGMKENYSESAGLDALDQPEDSNEHGDDIEADRHDMIAAIRRKMRKSPMVR